MTWRWPSPRTLRRTAIGVVAVLLLSLLLLRIFAMTPMARGLVEARVEAMTVRSQTLELEGFEGDLLGRMSVASLSVQDASGVWMTAKDVELSWGPLGLLTGHLRLKDVASNTLTVSRRPSLGPSGSGGSALSRYTLQSLNISALSLGAGVAGPAQSYKLTGRLEAGGSTGEAALNLSPHEGRGDRAEIDLSWGGTVPLEGRVDIDGAPGGLVATLLQAPEQAGITLSLDAAGTFLDWQLTAKSAVGGQSILDIEASRQNSEYAAQGHVVLTQLERLISLQSRFGERITFQTRLNAQQQLSGEIDAGTFSSVFAGLVQRTKDSMTIEAFELDASNVVASVLTNQNDLDLPNFAATGTLYLSADRRSFDGEVSAPVFVYRDYSLSGINARGRVALEADAISSDATLQVETFSGFPERLQQILDNDARLDLKASLNRADQTLLIDSFALNTKHAQSSGQGRFNLGGAVSLNGKIDLNNMPPLTSFTGTWSVDGPDLNTALLKLDGAVAVDQSIDAVPQIIDANSQISVAVKRQKDALILQRAALRTGRFEANASGTLQGGQLAINGDLAAASLSLTEVELNTLQAQFNLSGPAQSPTLALTASAADLMTQGRILQQPQVTGEVELAGDTAFSWRAQAAYLDTPVTLELDGSRRVGFVQLTRISAAWADLQATGAAALSLSNPRASEIDLTVTGSPPTLGEIDAQVSYRDEILDGTIALESASIGAIDFDRSEIALSGTWPLFSGTLDYQARLPLLGENRLISGAHGIRLEAERQAVVLDGALRLGGHEFTFISPLNIELSSGLEITGKVGAFNGEVELALKPLSQTPSQVTLTDIALQKFGPLINRPALRGTLNAEANIALLEGQLAGAVNATIANLARGAPDAPNADIRFASVIAEDRLDATLFTEDADQALSFTAQLTAPLAHQGQLFSIRPAPGAAIPVSMQGNGPIAPLWALAAPTDLRLEGDLFLDVNNGPGTTWRFQGPATFENGIFEDGITGLHLKEISVIASLRPDGIDFETARARGRNSGTIEASGLYGFDGNGSVAMQLNRLNAFKRPDISATVSGRAEIDRRNRRTQVSGDIAIDEARVNLEKLPGAGYTTLDVVFTDQLDAADEQAPAREAIILNLNIAAARRVYVIGSGVDTEWGLNVRVTGSPGRPSVIGRADLIRGEADLLSRRFRFSEGQVRFLGAPAETELTLRADRTSDGITSSITLTGTMTDPEITLSADPSLPDDEILARVLFGRSPSELSPLQAAQLAGAAAQLAGGNALNLVGQLQQATGLDRLDFGLNDDGAATLSTGKYIAEDVYLEIETGGTGAPGVALEWTPLENVAVDAEIDPELGPKVSIQWKRDFDRLPGEPKSD